MSRSCGWEYYCPPTERREPVARYFDKLLVLVDSMWSHPFIILQLSTLSTSTWCKFMKKNVQSIHLLHLHVSAWASQVSYDQPWLKKSTLSSGSGLVDHTSVRRPRLIPTEVREGQVNPYSCDTGTYLASFTRQSRGRWDARRRFPS
jgi:hypothetical protein